MRTILTLQAKRMCFFFIWTPLNEKVLGLNREFQQNVIHFNKNMIEELMYIGMKYLVQLCYQDNGFYREKNLFLNLQ